jgi:spermidine/putrescine-binding protein
VKIKLTFGIISLLTMVLLIFSSCAPKVTTTEETAATTTTIATETETATESAAELKVGGNLRLLGWDGYQFDAQFKDWAEKNNVTIDVTFLTTNDEIFAKLKAGDKYDIITPNQAYLEQLYLNNLLTPIDTEKIPNYKDISPAVLKALEPMNVYDGKIYSVPMCWGVDNYVYNADKTGPLDSWNDFLKPEFKGKFAIMDNATMLITIGAKVIGVKGDPSLITPEQLAQIKDWLLKVKRNARTIYTSLGDAKNMLESGDIIGALGGGYVVAGLAQVDGYNVLVNNPKEGVLVFLDSYGIPTNAPNPDTAYALLNEVLSTKVQLEGVVDYLLSATVSTKAIEMMTEKQKSLYEYSDIDKFLEANPLNGPIPLEEGGKFVTLKQFNDAWEEVKATQ